MVNCNADVGCRYEFSNCLLEAYTNKVMLSIVVISILILMQRWDLSVTATQFSGRYQRKITFARERSWTASGNFLFGHFIRSYPIPSNISFISYRTWAPILIYQESYQADRGVHWSNILMITIFMILKMITIITVRVMMMIMVWQKVLDLMTNTTRTCIAACDTTYYTEVSTFTCNPKLVQLGQNWGKFVFLLSSLDSLTYLIMMMLM